ncbi:MAG: HAD family hydrolase [Acidobacteriota bacterium]
MIKAVIFDLGKVIVPFDIQRGYAALLPHCAFPAEELPRRIAATGIVRLFEEGRISPEDFVRQFSDALGLKLAYDRFCELWSSIFLPHTLVPDELLEGLSRRYRLLLLSNTNAIHFASLRRDYPILRHFHDLILSYEVGAMKPDPRIYQAAIERAGCRPEECFFTDDMAPFVEAARQAGIDAVQFQSAAQVERELRSRGIEWRS